MAERPVVDEKDDHLNQPETTKPPLEVRAKERLWRAANYGTLAEQLIKIEGAWENGDDETVLETLRGWGNINDDMIRLLITELANENEERTWPIYRKLVWENLHQSHLWRWEKVKQAHSVIKINEEMRDKL